MRTFYKDPDAKLDYQVDWSRWLKTDTLGSSSFSGTPAGITISGGTFTATLASVWLAAGTVDTVYQITNHIATLGGRINDKTFQLSVMQL
jgi:hypothetical protein